MIVKIRRPNSAKIIELDVLSRSIVIAGPNGVGKSTIVNELATRYQEMKRVVQDGFPPLGFSIGGQIFNPALINPETIKNYKVSLGGSIVKQNPERVSISQREIEAALDYRNHDAELSDALLEIRQSISKDDLFKYRSDNYKDKWEVIQKIQVLLKRPKLSQMGEVFYAYHRDYATRKYRGDNVSQIVSEIGEAPWKTAQKAIDEIGLNYKISYPDIDSELSDINLFKIERKSDAVQIEGDRLSSGEAAALSLFNAVAGNTTRNRVYLFDDIDGFLHAPLLKKFVKILLNILDKTDSYAIWVTHSPVFVQMCERADFYFLSEYDAKPESITKAALIQRLSGGELIVAENFGTVFVEGADVGFYNGLFSTLTARKLSLLVVKFNLSRLDQIKLAEMQTEDR